MKTRLIDVALTSGLFLMFASTAVAAQTGVKALLQPQNTREAAPEFSLEDSSGQIAKLSSYRGKVLVLDFWATWCHGCKEEIPWFAGFHQKYRARGVRVVGISLDEDGWKAVRPFVKTASIPYRIVLGNDDVSRKYKIEQMPDTFIIDRRGRIAAKYTGLVDKEDVDAKIRALLSEP